MKIALMQPYFFPYIGYFQLISAVDEFIIYDNVQYRKGGWVNRNRILLNAEPHFFTLPLERAGKLTDNIAEKFISAVEMPKYKTKMLGQLQSAYRKAPFFGDVYSLCEKVLACDEYNLADFLSNSLTLSCRHLGITTKITRASAMHLDDGGLAGEERVLKMCAAKQARQYINAIGGTELYSTTAFAKKGIQLSFLKSDEIRYHQFSDAFVPHLSIIDTLMFNEVAQCRELLNHYHLVPGDHA